MELSLQIVDLRVQQLKERYAARMESELKVKNDEDKAKSAAFVQLVVKTILDLDEDAAFDCLVDGGNDYGIDAIAIGDVVNEQFGVTLFQGKYQRRDDGLGGFPQSGIEKMVLAVYSLFDPDRKLTANPRLAAQMETIRSLVRDDGFLPQVRVILCNNGKKWEAPAQQFIDNAGVGSQVTWEHVNHETIVSAQQESEPVDENLALCGKALLEQFNHRRVVIGKMKVTEIAALFNRNKAGDRLLERNVRRYLGLQGNPVNEAICKTLSDPVDQASFYFYNNGITFICTQFTHNALQAENWTVHVKQMQVINGGQTCKTIRQALAQLSGSPEPVDATVLVRIYELPADEPELIARITEATNSQSPVDFRDRRSNDELQRRLEIGLGDLGYLYRRKRGGEALKEGEITPILAAESVLSVIREKPHLLPYRRTQLFNQRYHEIFTKDLSPAEVVIATSLFDYAERKRKSAADDAPDFVPYASAFLALLMGRNLRAELPVAGARVDHRNFVAARTLWEKNQEAYYESALKQLKSALDKLHGTDTVSLQRLSAAFRRADLLEKINHPDEGAQ